MSRRNLGRHVSVLDGDTEDTNINGVEGETPVEEEVSAGVADTVEETAVVEAEDVGADQAVDAHENLEEIEDAVISAEANGGLTRESAVFAHLAMKAAMGAADYEYFVRSSKIPSMESFNGGSTSRQRYTTITLEGISSALRAFWDAIVRQVKKMWAAVKNWYLKVLDAAPRMKKRAEALAKKSSDITGAAEEKSFDMGGMHQLHIGGKAPDPTTAIKTMKILSVGADGSLGSETSGKYEGMFDEFDRLLESVANIDEDKLPKGIKTVGDFYSSKLVGGDSTKPGKVQAKFEDLIKKAKSTHDASGGKIDGGAKRFGTDLTVSGSPELFGGKQVAVFEPNDKSLTNYTIGDSDTWQAADITLVRYVRNSGVRFIDAKEKGRDIDSSGSFKTLSSSDIRTLMDELADICDHIITYKKAWEARDKQFNKMDSSAKKAISSVEKDKESKGIKVRIVKDVALGLSTAYQLGIRFENQLIQYLLNVGRATITWVERSMAQYKSV
jgi:hypothetical protein